MTPTKVVNRLMEFGPVVIRANARQGNHCVLATRIGIDVLQEFGIHAEPAAVRLTIVNATMRAYLNARPEPTATLTADEVQAIHATGAWALDVGDGRAVGDGWNGHLMIHLPKAQQLLDLNFSQFNRHDKDIRVSDAALFPWPTGRTKGYWTKGGLGISVHLQPENTGYMTGPDWNSARVRDIVVPLKKIIRDGTLGTFFTR
jgi:hypothetical protein